MSVLVLQGAGGKTKGSPETVSQVQKAAEKKVNMDYCTAGERRGTAAGTGITLMKPDVKIHGCGKVHLQITFWICSCFKLYNRY